MPLAEDERSEHGVPGDGWIAVRQFLFSVARRRCVALL